MKEGLSNQHDNSNNQYFFLDNCIDPVGIENGVVPDEGLSDSMNGTLQAGLFIKPNNARLNKEVTEFPFGWMARSEVDDWLQTDLGSTFKVS